MDETALRLAADQAGLISRRQLLAAGVTPAGIRARVSSGRWRVVRPGVVATFSGPLPELSRWWVALLAAGDGAVLAGRTALLLAGWRPDTPVTRVEALIPTSRQARAPAGVQVRRRRPEVLARAVGRPPRLPVELAVCDLTDRTDGRSPVMLAVEVVQQRLTTAERLRAELALRPRHARRADLLEVLGEVEDGVRSPLERRFRRDVVIAHGLPAARYNHRDREPDGTVRYRDADFLGGAVLVELDGRLAHPTTKAFRDRSRDNRAALTGRITLRYGWREVHASPCAVAAEVVSALHRAGWVGTPRPCGDGCTLATPVRP